MQDALQASQCFCNERLNLLLDNNAPRVLLASIHDILHPLLQLQRELAALALAHGQLHVLSAVMDQRHGSDEELTSINVSNDF